MGTKQPKLPKVTDLHFHPSPMKRIKFSDGKIIAMNRKMRRANKIYNWMLKKEIISVMPNLPR